MWKRKLRHVGAAIVSSNLNCFRRTTCAMHSTIIIKLCKPHETSEILGTDTTKCTKCILLLIEFFCKGIFKTKLLPKYLLTFSHSSFLYIYWVGTYPSIYIYLPSVKPNSSLKDVMISFSLAFRFTQVGCSMISPQWKRNY